MLEKVREFLRSTPFAPFKIRTSDGKEYRVPTPDHAFVPPTKFARVIIFDDEDHEVHLSGLHLVAVERIVVEA
jgi:hypothetical protein